MVPKILGLAGKSGAGKDWTADLICESFGYKKVSVATPIRLEWTQFLGEALRDAAKKHSLPESFIAVYEAYVRAIWTKPTSPEVRVGLQWWGTDYRREQDPNYWTPQLKKRLQTGEQIVIPDIRIPLEVDLVQSVGGEVWWIDRPDLGTVGISGHATENSISAKNCDRLLENHGSLSDLEEKIQFIFRFC